MPTLRLLHLLPLAALGGCTLIRTVRYGQPDARDMSMFPHRVMHASETPFRFAKAERQRTDLDTLSVRDPRTGRLVPLARHLADMRMLAFLVIRNDTIVYRTSGINTQKTMPEGVEGDSNDLLSIGTCQMQSLVNSLYNDGNEHIGIHRNFALN